MAGIIFSITLLVLGVFSYGYIDPHLSKMLPYVAYYHRPLATALFFLILLILFSVYLYFLKHPPKIWVILVAVCILIFSYPALTYDLFNYVTTAKVLYTYRENPYEVMPVEIPNEPNLAFTRAANKVALYGPVWLAIAAIPYYLGGGNVWATIFVYKLMNAFIYLAFVYFIYRVTKKMTNVIFFAINPLVFIEVIMNGHNDIYMMFLALGGLYLITKSRWVSGLLMLISSWFVKGATLALAPLLIFRTISFERMLVYAYVILATVFFVVAPIREELYPWYAVWLVTIASLLSLRSNRFIFGFTIVLSFALELRALPYMWMGYYEGPGPILRTLVTVIPVTAYCIYFSLFRKKFQKTV
jgi:hypothetical protein